MTGLFTLEDAIIKNVEGIAKICLYILGNIENGFILLSVHFIVSPNTAAVTGTLRVRKSTAARNSELVETLLWITVS
jgi:hypothetical protein